MVIPRLKRPGYGASEVSAVEHRTAPALNVTGVVQPDITRAVPVISLAAGRVVEIKSRLGDVVGKGQLLLKVSSNDVSGAFQTYLKAENDERLARLQLECSQLLFEHGAISKGALEQAENTAGDAKADFNAATERLHLLASTKTILRASSTSQRLSRGSSPISRSPPRASRDCQVRIPSPFPISRTSGSSATCTEMASTPCASATLPISISMPIQPAIQGPRG
jgi:multidrug efflux pump subunit AcrA (membrane-fusion protein)